MPFPLEGRESRASPLPSGRGVGGEGRTQMNADKTSPQSIIVLRILWALIGVYLRLMIYSIYSIFAPDSFTTLAHFAVSVF